jgi:protein-S-isoprenylcysteine O-methyltransferase Ste14
MAYVLHALIPALWVLWLGYWVVAAGATNKTRRREGLTSRLSHYGPLILGGLLLGVPNILGSELERPFHAPTPRWLLLAIALVATGLGFSALARARLGRNWSAEVTVKHDHELVRSGPYALVRHLIYAGVLLALIGTTLMVGKWRALIGLALIVAALLRKLTIEERFMAEQFGEAYARYRAEVPALIPFLV